MGVNCHYVPLAFDKASFTVKDKKYFVDYYFDNRVIESNLSTALLYIGLPYEFLSYYLLLGQLPFLIFNRFPLVASPTQEVPQEKNRPSYTANIEMPVAAGIILDIVLFDIGQQ